MSIVESPREGPSAVPMASRMQPPDPSSASVKPRWIRGGLSWDDEGQVQFPLQTIFWSVAVACAVMGFSDVGRGSWHGSITSFGCSAFMLFSVWLHSRRHASAAIAMALWGLAAFVATMMLFADMGVHDLSISTFPAFLIVGACMLSPRHYLIYSGAIVSGIGLLTWMDMNRIVIRSKVGASWGTLTDLTLIFAITAFAAGMVARSLRLALERSHQRSLELERKNAYIERQKHEIETLLEKAQDASRLKGEFLANMSHEIRTPMNAILGLSQLSLFEEDPARQRDNSRTIHDAAGALLTVINDILDLSAVEAGKLALEEKPLALRECVESVASLLRWRASEKGISLACEVDADVPAYLRGDAGRIRQILMNLAGNAVKFTESGGVKIGVRVLDRDRDQVKLRFSVSDSGIGIAAAQLERIFEPFTQIDGSARRRQGGTGLGLTICARLAQRMRGGIQVESEVGRGSTFHFDVALPVAEVAGAPPAGAHHETKPMNVLLAEDNAVNRRIATQMLQRLGHKVTAVGNGLEALASSSRQRFDAVLMDVQMPELDGLGAARAIRERERYTGAHLPIIALTAHAMAGDQEHCLAAGMDDYVAKPVEMEALRAALGRVAPVASADDQDRGLDAVTDGVDRRAED